MSFFSSGLIVCTKNRNKSQTFDFSYAMFPLKEKYLFSALSGLIIAMAAAYAFVVLDE